jgi:hypothetical protein
MVPKLFLSSLDVVRRFWNFVTPSLIILVEFQRVQQDASTELDLA